MHVADKQYMFDGSKLGSTQWRFHSINSIMDTLTVALGIMCNVLVCIAVWMTFSGRTLTDKIAVMILPVAMFVSSGLSIVEICFRYLWQ